MIYESYSRLKTGNYWIYQVFEVDSAGNGSPTAEYDSCYISKDTMIRGNTYYFLTSQNGGAGGYTCERWLRDSLSYLVDDKGRKWFSSEPQPGPFAAFPLQEPPSPDTLAWIEEGMEEGYATTAVPAGLFLTLNCRRTITIRQAGSTAQQVRYAHRRYALHLGIVSETMPFLPESTHFREKRLVRYGIQ